MIYEEPAIHSFVARTRGELGAAFGEIPALEPQRTRSWVRTVERFRPAGEGVPRRTAMNEAKPQSCSKELVKQRNSLWDLSGVAPIHPNWGESRRSRLDLEDSKNS